jgi:hypothetical protein
MRVFIGGVERRVPARWFWCLPGAKVFPSPHGAESSYWLQNGERNDDWGMVTPYPRDRDADDIVGLDRGLNPGYAGQSFVGQREWFTDGQLPAGITDPVPPPPMCVECLPPPHPSVGGLVIGGSALVAGPNRTHTIGGLVIGGSAIAYQQPAVTKGGLVLGGSAIAVPRYRVLTAGGLVLGGSASASMGTIAFCGCPHVGTTITATYSGAFDVVITLTWDGVAVFGGHTGVGCGDGFDVNMACVGGRWHMSLSGNIHDCTWDADATSVQCDPLHVVFTNAIHCILPSACDGEQLTCVLSP